MTTLREAAQQALEALEQAHPKPYNEHVRAHVEAITTLRAALEQPEQSITPNELAAALGWPGGVSDPVLDKVELLRMVALKEKNHD